jgi:hypothetical protein
VEKLVQSRRKRGSARERLEEAWRRWAGPWKFRRGVPGLMEIWLLRNLQNGRREGHQHSRREIFFFFFFFLRNKDKLKEKEIHRTIRSYNGISLLL